MKRLLILFLLIGVLIACSSNKDEVEKDSTDKENETVNEEETEQNKAVPVEKEEQKTETNQNNDDKPVEKSNKDSKEKNTEAKENKPKQDKEAEKKPAEKNEKVEEAATNIIWAQNNRDYKVLEGYLGQNITLNQKNNTLNITNVDYPHEAELLKGIKKEDLEHRFTEKQGKDHIVGFAAKDHERDMSYTIDLTMRVGKDSWKMLNMQINK